MWRWREEIAVAMALYMVAGSMFVPVFQSLIFHKVCLQEGWLYNVTDCSHSSGAGQVRELQAQANTISLVATISLCVLSMVSASFIGRLGDFSSRKLATLVPLAGLLLSDVTLLLQTYYFQLSPWWLVLSQAIFGLAGGYTGLMSTAFAYTSAVAEGDARRRAVLIARLEAALGVGGCIGYLVTSQLPRSGYAGQMWTMTVMHAGAMVYVLAMRSFPVMATRGDGLKSAYSFLRRPSRLNHSLRILLACFAVAYLAFQGTTSIQFFYLKARFHWDAAEIGLLKAANHAASTLMALFVYPLLLSRGVRPVYLAIVGLAARGTAKYWLALAWDGPSVFGGVVFESFKRFPPSALRSLMADKVRGEEHGRLFAACSVIEAVCSVLAAVVFNTLFPATMHEFPQLSFVIMGSMVIPAVAAIWWFRVEVSAVEVGGEGALRDVSHTSSSEEEDA